MGHAYSQSCPNPGALCAIHWPQSCRRFCSNSEKEDPLLTTKGVKFSSICFSLKDNIFFITLKVLSFSSEFKNKVNTQMTGYNLEEEGGIPPT